MLIWPGRGVVDVGEARERRHDADGRWRDGGASSSHMTNGFFTRLCAFSGRLQQQRGSGLVGADSPTPEVAGSGLGCRRSREERVNRERR